jgi:glycosyltransferase involved in cell wall biosynthesis
MLRTFKRADLLIEIARRLPQVRFVVCGGPTTFLSPPGYGEQMVSALRAQPNIEYLGKVAPDKSIEIITNASLLLSTSDEEGFPSTFLEAWAGGTPVISLKLDPDSLIQKHQLGAVPGSIENTVRAIAEMMESPGLRDEIAVRSRQYIASTHTGKAVAQQFQQAILAS